MNFCISIWNVLVYIMLSVTRIFLETKMKQSFVNKAQISSFFQRRTSDPELWSWTWFCIVWRPSNILMLRLKLRVMAAAVARRAVVVLSVVYDGMLPSVQHTVGTSTQSSELTWSPEVALGKTFPVLIKTVQKCIQMFLRFCYFDFSAAAISHFLIPGETGSIKDLLSWKTAYVYN